MSSLPGKTLYASGFNPRNIPGCALWLDAADRNTFTLTGSNISQWNDKSGNGRNATQSTAGNRPTYNSTSNFVNFTRTSSQFMNLPDSTLPSGNSSYAYFVVCTWYQLADGHGIIGGGNYGTTNQVFAARSINTTGQVVTYWWGNDLTSSNNAYSANTPVLLDFMYTAGSTRSIVVNGTINVSDTPGTRSQGTGNNTIGRTYPALSEFLNGNIQEIVVYSNALTTSERQQVEGYLASKWGLTSGLPATHPFKLYPVYTRPFQPVDISGCTLWLDAADRATFTFSGANITQWNDKSGNANHAFNSTGTLLPTLGTNSVSLPAVDFNSAYLMNNNAFGLSNMSVFVVGEERTTNASNVYSGIVIFKGITGGPNAGTTEDYAQTNAILIATPNTTETTTCIQVYSQLPPFPQLSGSGGNGYWTYRLYEVLIRTGTASEIFLNGTSNASYTLKNRSGNSAGYLLSARQFNGSFTVGRLKHSEVLSYDRVLSTSERQQVEGYLATKWGLRGNIPATHPFKLFPPLTPVFTPVQISGCGLWLDAADRNTLTLSGTNVTAWTDKSGSNNAATFTSNRPSYSNNSVTTANGNQAFTVPSTSISQSAGTSGTLFLVYKDLQTPAGTFRALFGSSSPFNAFFQTLLRPDSFSYQVNQTNATTGLSNALNTTNTLIYCMNYSVGTTTGSVQVNGTTHISSYTSNVSPSGALTLSGTGWGDTGNVSINEVVSYTSNLSTSQRQQVEGYLASKWGLLDSLPSTHPYKKIRP